MTVTTSSSSSTASTASSLAASAKFKTFAVVYGISFTLLYTLGEILGWPLFTFHPATNRFDLGWAPGRSGEGPAMYWYGWVASCLVFSPILAWLATMLPEHIIKKVPQPVLLALLWVLPILAFIPLTYGLMPFWTK
jgi:hypothetical protein